MGNLKQHHLGCKGREERNKNEQDGEQEWGEICWKNPIRRLRHKTKKEEYIKQLREEIRKGRTMKRKREERGQNKGKKENKRREEGKFERKEQEERGIIHKEKEKEKAKPVEEEEKGKGKESIEK